MKSINQIEFRLPDNWDAVIKASAEHAEESVSVGGLAVELGTIRGPFSNQLPPVSNKALARVVEFGRRERQWTVEELAEKSGLTEAEVLAVETGESVPEPRVLHGLSGALKLSYPKLLDLAGHTAERSDRLSAAALRFAARSESMDRLDRHEQEAFHEFLKVLAE